MRQQLLDLFWEDAKHVVFCTKAEFEAMVKPIDFVGGDGYGMSIYGHEIHVVGTRRCWITRRIIREFLVPLLREKGYLTTYMPKDDPQKNHDFLTRLGFFRTGETETDVLYRIERCNYE